MRTTSCSAATVVVPVTYRLIGSSGVTLGIVSNIKMIRRSTPVNAHDCCHQQVDCNDPSAPFSEFEGSELPESGLIRLNQPLINPLPDSRRCDQYQGHRCSSVVMTVWLSLPGCLAGDRGASASFGAHALKAQSAKSLPSSGRQ
ncbi:MAG: hypothetical protein CM15mP89_3960 [Gammaproteobacteria bacterium]|nr:MAG: hypothetical protein CM15mP89_3960 [Gammaproteobacteria bacterium]